MSAEDFGQISVARNFATFLMPVISIGLGVTLPRFCNQAPDFQEFLPGIRIIFISVALVFLATFVSLALSFVGVIEVYALGGVIGVGLAANKMLETDQRVHGKIVSANFVKGPAFLLILTASVAVYVVLDPLVDLLKTLSTIVAMSLPIYILTTTGYSRPNWSRALYFVRQSAKRVPAAVLKGALTLLPITYVTTMGDFVFGAVFSMGILILRASESLLGGFTPALVYQITKLKEARDYSALTSLYRFLLEVAFVLSPILFLTVYHFLEVLLTIIGNQIYFEYQNHILIIAASMIPYSLYIMCRSILDSQGSALEVTVPLVCAIALCGCILLAAQFYRFSYLEASIAAYFLSVLTLAVITFGLCIKYIGKIIGRSYLKKLILLTALLMTSIFFAISASFDFLTRSLFFAVITFFVFSAGYLMDLTIAKRAVSRFL